MKIGNRVEVVAVPRSLPSGMGTQALFEACVGRVFPIADIDDNGLLELHVGEVVGQDSYLHSIWIEPGHVVLHAARHFDVELFIIHPSLDPEDISRVLGLEAHFSHRVGEPRKTPAGTLLAGLHPDTRWRHSVRHTVTEQWFASAVVDFVGRLEPHAKFFASLRETGGSATVIIQFLGDGYFADSMPLTTLVKLSELGLSLGIECFVDRQT